DLRDGEMRPRQGLQGRRGGGRDGRGSVRGLFRLRPVRSVDEVLPATRGGYRPFRGGAAAEPGRHQRHFHHHGLQGLLRGQVLLIDRRRAPVLADGKRRRELPLLDCPGFALEGVGEVSQPDTGFAGLSQPAQQLGAAAQEVCVDARCRRYAGLRQEAEPGLARPGPDDAGTPRAEPPAHQRQNFADRDRLVEAQPGAAGRDVEEQAVETPARGALEVRRPQPALPRMAPLLRARAIIHFLLPELPKTIPHRQSGLCGFCLKFYANCRESPPAIRSERLAEKLVNDFSSILGRTPSFLPGTRTMKALSMPVIGCISLVLAACSSVPRPLVRPETIAASGAYTHAASGMSFPIAVGDFRRVTLLRYDSAAR